jgi:serine protease Do
VDNVKAGSLESRILRSSPRLVTGCWFTPWITSPFFRPIRAAVQLQQSSQAKVQSATIYTGIEGADLSNSDAGDKASVAIAEIGPFNAGVDGGRLDFRLAALLQLNRHIVDNVKAGSAAARIGLKKGDVIQGVNQQPVTNLGASLLLRSAPSMPV